MNSRPISSDANKLAKKQLRRTMGQQRLEQSHQQRIAASHHAAKHLPRLLDSHRLPRTHGRLAIFLDAFGEMPIRPIIDWARRYRYQLFLPVVHQPDKPLCFINVPIRSLLDRRLPQHPLGMRQPATGHEYLAIDMHMIIVPLVAIDTQGYRMGMGGGFYDRTLSQFAFSPPSRPLTVGWAYDFQVVSQLPHEPWDMRLDALITPSRLWRFS